MNPPLEIDGVPEETKSLALVMDDPDAVEPAGKVWDHWVVWNIDPTTSTIPEDWNALERFKDGTITVSRDTAARIRRTANTGIGSDSSRSPSGLMSIRIRRRISSNQRWM